MQVGLIGMSIKRNWCRVITTVGIEVYTSRAAGITPGNETHVFYLA